ncbi:MAG: replicative DNA helicase, partial [Patescibacteria group bacterium]
DQIEKRIFGISQLSQTQKFVHIKDELSESYERLERLHKDDGKGLRGVPTGFRKLDSLLSGFQRSDLILLGARPSYGKTSLALDMARHAAEAGHSVGIFSLEMSREQVMDRLIAAEAQVPLWKLRTGRLREETDFELIRNALAKLSEFKMFIDDAASPTILQMRGMARRLQIEHGLDLLIIDYLQLIKPRANIDNMVQQVTEISRGLKSLAREMNIPVLALSQLSRAVDQRDDKTPRLSDLRESGSLEQDSDIVLFIARKDRDTFGSKKQENLGDEEQNLTRVIIAKHRNGPLGVAKLKFDEEKVSFRDIDEYHTDDEN